MKVWIRTAAAVLAMAFLLPLGACGRQQEIRTIRVGVALYQQDDTFISTVVQQLERMTRKIEQERGVKINLNLAYGRASQPVQNEQVDRFLKQGCDMICVNIVDRTAAAGIVDRAQAEEVPVIFFNREPVREDLERWEHAYYVGLPAEQAGKIQGSIVADAWEQEQGETLDRNGDGVLQYVILEGEAGHQDAILRTRDCIETLSRRGIQVEKLAHETADWQRGQASLRMQQWLEKFGREIEVVFANNDDMALGAIDACETMGIRNEKLPFIVGVDATPPAIEALRKGILKGTVRNDAAGEAKSILAILETFLDGVAPGDVLDMEDGKYIWLSYEKVTAETLKE